MLPKFIIVVITVALFTCGASVARLGEDKVDGLSTSFDQPNTRTLKEGQYNGTKCYKFEEENTGQYFAEKFLVAPDRHTVDYCFNFCIGSNFNPYAEETDYKYFSTYTETTSSKNKLRYCMCGGENDFVNNETVKNKTPCSKKNTYKLYSLDTDAVPNDCGTFTNGILYGISATYEEKAVCCSSMCGDCGGNHCNTDDPGDCCPKKIIDKGKNCDAATTYYAPCVIGE